MRHHSAVSQARVVTRHFDNQGRESADGIIHGDQSKDDLCGISNYFLDIMKDHVHSTMMDEAFLLVAAHVNNVVKQKNGQQRIC